MESECRQIVLHSPLQRRPALFSVIAIVAVSIILTVSWTSGGAGTKSSAPGPAEDIRDHWWLFNGPDAVSSTQTSCQLMQRRSQNTIINMEVSGGERREFRLFLPGRPHPSSSGSSSSYRGLMVVFHGFGGRCDFFLNHHVRPTAEKLGIVVASACGVNNGRGFDAGVCCGFGSKSVNEIAFARAIVDAVSSYTCTGFGGRTMALGFSNGGMLSQMLGCTSADVFSSVASISGVVAMRPGLQEGLRACDAAIARRAERPSVLMIHGDADSTVPWTGQNVTSMRWVARLPLPDVPSNTAAWAARNGCTNTTVMTMNNTNIMNMRYEHCMPSSVPGTVHHAVVELVRDMGGQHTIPIYSDFDSISYAFEFGLKHSWTIPNGAAV